MTKREEDALVLAQGRKEWPEMAAVADSAWFSVDGIAERIDAEAVLYVTERVRAEHLGYAG